MDNNTNSPFATPDAGNLNSGRRTYYPEVEYSAMKTPENFVADVTPEKVATSRANFKLGFHYFDNDETVKSRVAIDKFSFVVLEVMSSISGYRETQSGQPGIKYYSNQVVNSQVEPFALFEKGIKRPIATGFYSGKKHDNDFAKLVKYPKTTENEVLNAQHGNFAKIPDGAGFNQHFICWWIEGGRVIDLKLSTMVSREIKVAISNAEAAAGRKVKPENVKTFALAQGGAFWGFSVVAFKKVTKDGADYDKRGEMFLVPKFVSGVVKTEGNGANPDLHARCAELQKQIRAEYALEVERRSKYGNEVNSSTEGGNELQPAYFPQSSTNDGNFPAENPGGYSSGFNGRANEVQMPKVEVDNYDDLPF